MKTRKAQEEVMGFVLIVLIVIIIGVVFFAFSMRKQGESIWQQSAEADDLLASILSCTTQHKLSGGENLSVRELLRECADGNSCENIKCCQAANATIYEIFGELELNVTGRFIHGYNLSVMHGETPLLLDKPYIFIGNSTGSSFISDASISGSPPGYTPIEVRLRCWYSQK